MDNPCFADRLHLKKIDSLKEFLGIAHSVQVKYDGCSVYIDSDAANNVTFWSPRISKRTGRRISYTDKLKPFCADIRIDIPLKAMGELLFYRDGKALPATSIGGLMNSHDAIPSGTVPEIRVYRVEGLMRPDMSLFHGNIFKPCETVADPGKPKGEGYVGLDALGTPKWKYKVRDEQDWTLVSVDLCDGDKGGIAGTTKWKAEDGKEYYLGPSAGFKREEVLDMREHPAKYIGRTAKILGYRGHAGRSARFSCWHMDKGCTDG